MNENLLKEEATHYQKKIRTDALNIRRKCHITYRADVVIRCILPYLMTVLDETLLKNQTPTPLLMKIAAAKCKDLLKANSETLH